MSAIIHKSTYPISQYPNKVSVLWFNREDHVELALDGKMYNLCLGEFKKIRSEKNQRNRTLGNRGAEYYQFDLALTKREYDSLSSALMKKQGPDFDYCSGSTSRYISKYTDIKIPFLAARSPVTLAKCLFKNPQDYRISLITCVGSQKNIQEEFPKAYFKEGFMCVLLFWFATFSCLGLAAFLLPD